MDKRPWYQQPNVLLCFLLGGLTVAVYWTALRNGFVDFDDHDYVTDNVRVTAGLTWGGAVWAFQGPHSGNWHPLATLSHMLDCQLFGLHPWGHHLGNVLLHAANAVLLFLLLQQLTGSLWRSAFVAAVFALHPTHVESVAWISERKDVLSTFFGFLTLIAYTRFARSQIQAGKTKGARRKWYLLALGLFALALMSKPMMVTLPCVMLLLDFWPLQRGVWNDVRGWGQRVIEKWPFFVLTAISSLVTFFVQKGVGAVSEHIPLGERVGNAFISYARYLGKTFWPVELSVFYPLNEAEPAGYVWGAGLLLLVLTALVLGLARSRRYLVTGWFWFVGMLVPVIGLVQVGSQAMADRYTYITQTGVIVIVVWALAPLWARSRVARLGLMAASGAVLLVLAGLTFRQIRSWQDTETLFAQAVKATPENARAHAILGYTLAGKGRREEGLAHLHEALRIKPDYGEAYGKLGHLMELGRDYPQAIDCYRQAVELNPRLGEALNNLAWIRSAHPDLTLRNGAEAVQLAERACRLTRYDKTLYLGTLAAAYAEAGRFDDAIRTATQARDHALRWGEQSLAETNDELLIVYRAGKAYRDAGMNPP